MQIDHAGYASLTSAIRAGNMDVYIDWYPHESA